MRLIMTLIGIHLNFLNENDNLELMLIWSKGVTRNRILRQNEITKNTALTVKNGPLKENILKE